MRVQDLKGAVAATSVYFNGRQLAVNATVSLPNPTPTISEVTAAGGTVEIPVHSKIDPMECTITLHGVDKAWLNAITPEPGDLIVNIVQTSVSANGVSEPEHIKAYMRAVNKTEPGIEASYGENIEPELVFSVLSYRQTVNGETYRHFDPIKGIYKVNGKNYADKITAMI